MQNDAGNNNDNKGHDNASICLVVALVLVLLLPVLFIIVLDTWLAPILGVNEFSLHEGWGLATMLTMIVVFLLAMINRLGWITTLIASIALPIMVVSLYSIVDKTITSNTKNMIINISEVVLIVIAAILIIKFILEIRDMDKHR